MRSVICLLLLSALVLPTASRAETPDPSFFTDWLKLSALLRSKGVDPVGINWVAIDTACLGLKTTDDQTLYNRCKYEKAMDQRDFDADRSQCADESRRENPQYLLREGVETVQVKQPDGSIKSIQRVQRPPVTRWDLDALRRGSQVACMRSYGWRNADDWMAGRRE